MFELIISFIVEATVYYLFRYPGAFLRWLVFMKKKSFKEVLSEDVFINCFVGVVSIGLLLLSIFFVFKI